MTNSDRTLPVVIYGYAPIRQPISNAVVPKSLRSDRSKWHRIGDEYQGDECRNLTDHRDATPKSEIAKRWLSLEPPNFDNISGHDATKHATQPRTVVERPLKVPANNATLYCVKTGQPVGTTLEPYTEPPSICHPVWKMTDGTNLDYVQERDPRAYAAFCLGLIDSFWRRKQHRQKLTQSFMTREDAIAHHWSLVRTYDLLGHLEPHQATELADALCRFCTYAPLSYRVLDQDHISGRRSADLLAEAAIAGKLIASLEKACLRTMIQAERFAEHGASVKMPKFEIHPTSIEDAAKGPSNIRAQQKSKEYHKNARQNKLMAELYRQFGREFVEMGWGASKKQGKSQASALLGRLSRTSPDANVQRASDLGEREFDMLDELDRIMGGQSFGNTFEEDDDDIVEVRSIPRALVESLEPPKHATQQSPVSNVTPLHATPQKLSTTQSFFSRRK